MDKMKVDVSNWLGEGFSMFFEQVGHWLGVAVLYILITILSFTSFAIYFVWMAVQHPGKDLESILQMGAQSPAFWVVFGLTIVFVLFVSAGLYAGFLRCSMVQLQGKRFGFGDFFKGFPYALRLCGLFSIMVPAMIISFMLCILPMFLVFPLFFFAPLLIVHENRGVFESIQISAQKAKEDFGNFAVFAWVANLIQNSLSPFTLPLFFTFGAIAYRDAFGIQGAKSYRKENQVPSHHVPPAVQSPPSGNAPPPSRHS